MSRLNARHFALAALALALMLGACADPELSKPSTLGGGAATVSETDSAPVAGERVEARDDEMPLGSADLDVVVAPMPEESGAVDAKPSWLPPVVGRISQHFGARHDEGREDGSLHDAIDIAAPVGTEVLAPCDMRVSYIGYRTNAGRFLIADGDGYEFTFAHLSHVDVVEGQRVGRGDVVALTGITGTVTGPHLHFRAEKIEKNGRTAIDPLPYLGLGEDAQPASAVAHAP